ncbi:MAG: tetratricopeptide repeat protein [Saprospiraceae bacterium]|nr:tetratricopeptide repeat protein [Saprospiraceae bacterium]
MDNEELRNEQIEKYLDGAMTNGERLAFESQMRNDPTLQQAVDDERLVRAAMQRLQEQELRAKMEQWWQESAAPPRSAYPFYPYLKYGLLMLAVAVAGYMLWPSRTTVSNDGVPPTPQLQDTTKPADGHLEPTGEQPPPQATIEQIPQTPSPNKAPNNTKTLATSDNLSESPDNTAARVEDFARLRYVGSPPLASRKSENTSTDNVLAEPLKAKTQGKTALDKKEYGEALDWLQRADTTDHEVRYWMAEAHFQNRNYDEAVRLLQPIATALQFRVDAQKNLVLCYLAQYPNRKTEYEQALQRLLESPSKTLREWAESLKAELAGLGQK